MDYEPLTEANLIAVYELFKRNELFYSIPLDNFRRGTIQDLCVEAVLKESKDLAIATLAIDPNVGSFEMADKIFKELYPLQKEFLPNFK